MGASVSVSNEHQSLLARVSSLPAEKQRDLLVQCEPLIVAAETAALAEASIAATAAATAATTTTTAPDQPRLLEINITVHSAQSLRATDGRRGRGDPYLYVEVLSQDGTSLEQLFSSTVRNNHRTPSWNENLRVIEPQGTQLRIQIWDQDTSAGQRPNGGRDDLLGELTFNTNALPTGRNTHDLQGQRAQGSLALTFATTVSSPPPQASTPPLTTTTPSAPSTPSAPVPTIPSTVTRREIREMPRNDQVRVCNAFGEMMNNGEYFRVAGYHGWPNDFCAHRQEHFPSWHRAYLTDVERAFIQADIQLGNDGNIGLPYWDWTRLDINGETYPSVLNEFFSEIPEGLQRWIRSTPGGENLLERGYNLNDGTRLRRNLQRAGLAAKVTDALLETEHWRFASTRWGGGRSLEDPHNDVHVACGWPMTSVKQRFRWFLLFSLELIFCLNLCSTFARLTC